MNRTTSTLMNRTTHTLATALCAATIGTTTLAETNPLEIAVETNREEAVSSFRAECAAAGQKGAICVGWATSMEKVRPRDGVLPKVATDLFVRLARGEKESVQLFVVPMSGDLRNVKVAVNGDLAMQNGDAAFAASNIAVSVLGYLNITNKPPYKTGQNVATTNAPGYRRDAIPASLGWWPDPIMSHLDHADVLGDDVQGFWIRVRAPDDQRAGLYEGRVTVSAAGVEPVDLPFMVRVNDFSVPKKPMLPLAVPFQGISRQTDINRDAANAPDAPPKLWGRHRDEWIAFMSDHYVTCGGIYVQRPNFDMLERQRPFGVEGGFNLGIFDAPKTTTNEAVVAEWRKKTITRLVESYEKAKSLGIADRAFIYGCDEYHPHTFGRAEWAAAEIKKALPDVPIMTTAADRSYGASGKLKSFDCFVSTTQDYNPRKAEAARKCGRKVWWYFACDNHAPYANSFIEGQGIEMRSVVGAQAVKYRPDGFLYYWIGSNCSYRPAGDNPFTDCEPRTWPSRYHGDGGWLSCGPDGIPLSTIRFENFADGLEDYAYAMLLEEKLRAVESKKLKAESAGGDNWIRRAKQALAVPDTVVQSVRNYTDDPAVIYRWRDEMADLIEEGAVVAECGGAARPLRFMTFNIFGAGYDPERGGPGGFKAEEREGRAMALVRRYSPDIISWQEVNEQWWPSPLFCGMEEYGVVRGDEDEALVRAGADLSKRRPHWVNHEPLMYRKDRLVLLDSGLDFYHISLQFEKSLTWAVLEDRSDRRRFIAFATHFWWKQGEEADAIRELNARHVLWRIDAIRAKWGNLPVIGGGDLNCVKGSLALKTFDQFGYDDAGETAPVRSTVPSEHGALVRDAEGHCRGRVGKVGEKGHCMIDHVLCERGRVVPLRHDVVIDEDAVDISDHSPVVVDFAFK